MVLQPRLRHRDASLSSNSSASSDFDAGFNFLGQASAAGGDRVSRAISIASTSCAEPHADDCNGGGYCSSDGSYIAAVAAASAAAAARSGSGSRHTRESAGSVLASAGLGAAGDGGIVLGGGGGGARVPVAATRSPSPAAQRGLSRLRRHLAGPRANSPVITERARQMPREGRVEDSLLQRREEYMARRDVRRRGHEMCELMTLRGPQICERSRRLCEEAAGRRRSASVASGGGGGGVGGSSVGGGGGDAFDRLYASAVQQQDRKTRRAEEAAAEAEAGVCGSVEAYVAAASARSAAASPSWRSASSSGAGGGGGSQRRRQQQQQTASTDRFAAWQHARDAKVLSRQQAREDAEMAGFSGTPRLNPLSLRIAENLERSSGGERLTQQQRTARMSEPRAASPAPPPPPPPPLHLRRRRRRSSSCSSVASRTRSTERLRVVQEAASSSASGRPLHIQHLRSSSPAAAAAAAAAAPSDPATGQKLFQPRVNTKANRRLLSASGGSGSATRSRSGSAGGAAGGNGASTVWEQLSERGAEKEGRMQRLQAQRAKEEETRQTGRPTLGAYTTLLADLKAQREGGGSRLSQETHHVKSKATLGCLQREELNNSFTPTVLEESQRLDERRHPASALRRRARSGSAGSRVALLATKQEEYTRRRERARHEQERDELEALRANRVDAGAVPRPASELFRNNLNWDKRRQARLAQARQDLAEEEVSECTFKPNVDRAENLEPSSAGYSAAVSKRNEWVKAIYALRGGEPRGEPSRMSEMDVGGTSGELDFFPQSIVQMP